MTKQTIKFGTSLVLAFLGFLDATYLTILHYKNIIPPCSLAHGCETVLTSTYSTIHLGISGVGSIPIALIGSVYYIVLISLLVISVQINEETIDSRFGIQDSGIDHKSSIINHKSILILLRILTTSGLLVSIILVYIQAFVLHAFCQYCLTVEGINLLVFILAFV